MSSEHSTHHTPLISLSLTHSLTSSTSYSPSLLILALFFHLFFFLVWCVVVLHALAYLVLSLFLSCCVLTLYLFCLHGCGWWCSRLSQNRTPKHNSQGHISRLKVNACLCSLLSPSTLQDLTIVSILPIQYSLPCLLFSSIQRNPTLDYCANRVVCSLCGLTPPIDLTSRPLWPSAFFFFLFSFTRFNLSFSPPRLPLNSTLRSWRACFTAIGLHSSLA